MQFADNTLLQCALDQCFMFENIDLDSTPCHLRRDDSESVFMASLFPIVLRGVRFAAAKDNAHEWTLAIESQLEAIQHMGTWEENQLPCGRGTELFISSRTMIATFGNHAIFMVTGPVVNGGLCFCVERWRRNPSGTILIRFCVSNMSKFRFRARRRYRKKTLVPIKFVCRLCDRRITADSSDAV